MAYGPTVLTGDGNDNLLNDTQSIYQAKFTSSGNVIVTNHKSGGDTLSGSGGNDILYGYQDNDSYQGGDGNDKLIDVRDIATIGDNHFIGTQAGTSKSVIYYKLQKSGDDTMDGGLGNDLFQSYHGADSLLGGAGADTIYGGQGNDTANGGAGNDLMADSSTPGAPEPYLHSNIEVKDGYFVVNGDAYWDQYYWWSIDDYEYDYDLSGNDVYSGGDGNDKLIGMGGNDTLRGDNGDDTLNGGSGDDSLSGGLGNDLIEDLWDSNVAQDTFYSGRGGGNDTLSGGAGRDTLSASIGDDLLYGNEDNDHLTGGKGKDTLFGGTGDDVLIDNDVWKEFHDDPAAPYQENGYSDFLYGEIGNDTLISGAGADMLQGGAGNDVLYDDDSDVNDHSGLYPFSTVPSNDTLQGGDGNDKLTALLGNNLLKGDAGIDTLIGGDGADTLHGGNDNDILQGGKGRDVLYGNGGQDMFVYTALAESTHTQLDFIIGFIQGEDRIGLNGLGFTGIQQGAASGTLLGWSQKWGDTHITNASGSFEVEIDGLYNLNGSDFIFA